MTELKYEYNSLIIYGELRETDIKKLNELYANGWEYVQGVAQNVSLQSKSYEDLKHGNMLITLKRPKNYNLLP